MRIAFSGTGTLACALFVTPHSVRSWRTSRHRSLVAPASCRLFRLCFSPTVGARRAVPERATRTPAPSNAQLASKCLAWNSHHATNGTIAPSSFAAHGLPIYRWNGSRFVEDSKSHPDFYSRLLVQDKEKLPSDASGIVLVNLSRIAVLSGDLKDARAILADALSGEREKGSAADPETLRLISEKLHALK
jgi:hypothetical protein